MPPGNPTYTCVIAAIYLRCCQYIILVYNGCRWPPISLKGTSARPRPAGAARRTCPCAMSSPSVSSIPSSIACTGRARPSSSGPRRFTSCSIFLSIATMWSTKTSSAHTYGLASLLVMRRSRAVLRWPARPLATVGGRNGSFWRSRISTGAMRPQKNGWRPSVHVLALRPSSCWGPTVRDIGHPGSTHHMPRS